jgi:rhodanese-related sulfurtransferase
METMVDVTRVTADEVKARMDRGEKFTFVDARNPEAWAESDLKLPSAFRLTPEEVEKHVGDLPRDRTIITYCT